VRLLLDSHAFLWWLRDDTRLSRRARTAISAPTSVVFVSAASIWEIAIKVSVGKVRWRERGGVALSDSIGACGFTELAVTARHAAAVRDLPRHHGDPFDRLLVAQALTEDLRVVTTDDAMARYGVPVLPADA
jgi:PIN domain nuclease of toxin-antitoxin system